MRTCPRAHAACTRAQAHTHTIGELAVANSYSTWLSWYTFDAILSQNYGHNIYYCEFEING